MCDVAISERPPTQRYTLRCSRASRGSKTAPDPALTRIGCRACSKPRLRHSGVLLRAASGQKQPSPWGAVTEFMYSATYSRRWPYAPVGIRRLFHPLLREKIVLRIEAGDAKVITYREAPCARAF